MSDAIRLLGQWRDVTTRYIRVGGVWRKVSGVAVRVGGAWRNAQSAAGPFSASAPTSVSGFRFAPGGTATVSATATVTVQGGAAPYSYQWSYVSGDNFVLSAPTNATTRFSDTGGPGTANGLYRWTATDANASTATGTTSVTLTIEGNQ